MESMTQTSGSSGNLRGWLIFLGFTAVVGYLLANGHTVHVLSVLPYLIFLACPLMMLFMHHGNHSGHDSGPTKP